jgi:hypothetical protein
VPRLDSINGDTNSLVFLLCLPHELVRNGLFRTAILCCHAHGSFNWLPWTRHTSTRPTEPPSATPFACSRKRSFVLCSPAPQGDHIRSYLS